MPQPGDRLSTDDVELILEKLQTRHKNFPDEPAEMTLGIILLGMGDQFTPVSCVGGEWSGLKEDIPKREDPNELPKCPAGHVLTEGRGLRLGWLEDDT